MIPDPPRRPGTPIGERGRQAPTEERPSTTAPPSRTRHALVTTDTGTAEGLVLFWNKDENGWRALVTWVQDEQVRTAWVTADRLRPVGG